MATHITMTVHGGHGGHGSHDLRWEMTGDFNVASITVGPSLRTLPLPIFVWRVELRFEALVCIFAVHPKVRYDCKKNVMR